MGVRRFAHPRVLLVQPDRDDREMYVTYLRFHGVTTLAVSTAAKALPLAPSSDVIVTGIRLPGAMDGLEFVRALRRIVTRHTPVIVLTACASRNDREQAFAAGCDRFLTKPCLPDTLLAELKAARRVGNAQGSFARDDCESPRKQVRPQVSDNVETSDTIDSVLELGHS